MAEIDRVESNTIHLVFFPSGKSCKELISRQENLSLILELAKEHFQSDLSIRLSVDPNRRQENPSAEIDRKPSHRIKEMVANSPRLKSLIEKIDGEVIAVREVEK
jgi:hypothetical protein